MIAIQKATKWLNILIIFCKKFLKNTYIKDTYDFLSKLRTAKVQPHTLLITLDVESMYTNIDNEQGLEAVRNIFQANPSPRRSDKHIFELLELSLKNNDFEFNNETFLQISGTAMGKKFAPSYANLFMAQWENTALDKCYQKPKMYFRYLDDIWILWDHGETQFQTFFDILNTHSPAIRLSARVENSGHQGIFQADRYPSTFEQIQLPPKAYIRWYNKITNYTTL